MDKKVIKKGHSLKLMRRLVVTDKDGKVISDSGEKEAHSYLIQFLEFICAMFDSVITSATNTDGAESTIYTQTGELPDFFFTNAGINNDAYGIIVGTNAGSTPEDNTNFKLDTKIAEGSGAGQLTHNATTLDAPAVVGTNVDCVIKRSFTNNSGSTITVKETGVRVRYNPTGKHHLIMRDIVSDTPIPDLCSLSVYYTMRTTVTV